MKNVLNSFKDNIKKYGRQINAEISFNNTIISKEDINCINPFFNTFLFKSVMCGIEIDSNIDIPVKTTLNAKIGVKFENGNYEYIEYKEYTVYSCEKQEDTESYKIIAYDKMLESMIDYDLTVEYPITVRDYLIAIFDKLNWRTTNIPETFVNSTKQIKNDIHSGIDYTYRDVLDEIATITGSFLCIENGIPTLKYITKTNQIINEEYLSQDDVTIGEKYLINSLVFSRVEESDNIFRKDDLSIETNGLYEFKISDNQILSTNDRVDFIDELFDYLKTLEFYIFDIKSTGLMFFEVADMFSLSIKNNIYPIVLLNDEIIVDQDIEEKMYMDKPEETETDYKTSDKTDRRIKQAYILVDKQNQKISQVVEEQTEMGEKIAQQVIESNSIKSEVSSKIEKLEESKVSNTEYTQQIETLKSVIAQGDSRIEFNFKDIRETTDKLGNVITENQRILEEYIRFKGALIELGKVGNDFTAELSNTELAFKQNGTRIAYISNNKLYITDAEIQNKLVIGKFAFIPRANGNLSWKWIGG